MVKKAHYPYAVRNIYRFLLAAYVTVLGLSVLWPRTISELSQGAPASSPTTNTAVQAANNVLYIDGFPELLGNFVMLIPIALLLSKIFPTLKALPILLVCLTITISIEFLQIYIPGRVSDVRDVVTNFLGAAIAVGLIHLKTRHRN